FKHRPAVAVVQRRIGQHYLYRQVSFKHPSGLAAITHRQDVDTAIFKWLNRRHKALTGHDEWSGDFRLHIVSVCRQEKGAKVAPLKKRCPLEKTIIVRLIRRAA